MFVLIFILATFSCALIVTHYYHKKQKIIRRVEQLISFEAKSTTSENDKKTFAQKVPLFNLLTLLAKNIKTTEHKRSRIENALESSGLPLTVEEYLSIRIVGFVLTTGLAFMMGCSFIIAFLLGFLGWMIPTFLLQKKKSSRIAAFTSLLPQALETMSSAMKSGFSFIQAMQLVSKEMPDPMGNEFGKTLKEINLGVPMETAFENLLKRIPNNDLKILVTAVLIQRTTGGNLAQILETINETITERIRIKDELRALTSQGRMSAIIISLLPVVLGVILTLMNPDYFTPMFSHPLGWVLLGGGILSGLLGWILINKIVNIEV